MNANLSASRVPPVPFVKQWSPTTGTLTLSAGSVLPPPDALQEEVRVFELLLTDSGVRVDRQGTPIQLQLARVPIPESKSRYHEQIARQAYRLKIAPDRVFIESQSAAGMVHGFHTLAQLIGRAEAPATESATLRTGRPLPRVPCGEILDWPDLPVRMIMVDPARQNENFEYYKRVIRFAARYKINAILLHLTDDDTAALYHPDYPELMHPQAWTPDQARELVAFAAQFHIELIPEIESLGHSRMFTRRADFKDYLHQTGGERTETWMGTDIPGYTNVLCPASEKAYQYLDDMYALAAECFPAKTLHIGCDEVDMTSCARCEAKFPGISKTEWFRNHLLRCREIAARHGRSIALWGDMLLKDPAILDGLPAQNTIIYDWHYMPNVTADSVERFKQRGYEVIASPALMCAPHMVYPDEHNYTNIRRFTEIARDADVPGINTTIWIPQRYMSDILWPGIAYAGGHAWGGRALEDATVFSFFFRDYFADAPTPRAESDFARAWTTLASITWHRSEFLTACWSDAKSMDAAATLATQQAEKIRADREKLGEVVATLDRAAGDVRRNPDDWNTLRQAAVILDYALEHLQAAPTLRTVSEGNRDRLRLLALRGDEILQTIEQDWDRNRYADDPNKNGIHKPGEHLLYRFRQMQEFHRKTLDSLSGDSPESR